MRLIATIRKDLLVLLRDKGGLAIMFLMPIAMIVIMSLIQDAPFKDYQELKIPLLLVNKDSGALGKQIEQGLKESKIVQITKQHADDAIVKKQMKASAYQIAIIIPANASHNLNTQINQFVNTKLEAAGIPSENKIQDQAITAANSTAIQVLFAPGTKKSFKATILSSLKQSAAQLQTQTLLDFFSKQLAADTSKSAQEHLTDFISFKEIETVETPQEALILNSVQHNVPAWTIFGMFFIVISMAGSIIKEREEGSYTRIRTMPGSFSIVLTGKITAYLLICMIQCLLMLSTGIYLLPRLGLPALHIGSNMLALTLITLSTGLAATGFGIFTGTVFKTHQQASTFGAVSIVILAALGGIWIPVFIMPEPIQIMAQFSPLFWALSGYNKLFLSNATLLTIIPYALKLIVFFLIMLAAAQVFNRVNIK